MKTQTVLSTLIALVGAVVTFASPSAAAEEVTFLASTVVSQIHEDSPAFPFLPSILGSPVAIGDSFRIYYTFETTTPGVFDAGAFWQYLDAIKRIRVIIGNGEFSRSGTADAPITIVNNLWRMPGNGVDNYNNQYQFTFGQQTATGIVYCYFAAQNITPTPNAGLVITGLPSDPPDLSLFSMPGYPASIGQSCYFTGWSEGQAGSVEGVNSSLTRVGGPVGSDVDGDGLLDVNDSCPADPSNSCSADSSGAAVVSAASGGTVTTPNAEVSITVDAGDIQSDSTLSVTKVAQASPNVDLAVGSGPSVGEAVASYDFEPDGTQFNNPVSLSVTTDVTALTPEQRNSIDLYRFADLNGDGINETYVPLTASCSVVENPVGTFKATCLTALNHFSKYAVVAPRDSDGDGIFDSFAGQFDKCQTQDARGFDADNDGCIDTFSGLTDLVHKLVLEAVISAQMETSLTSKVANANASATKDNICAAISQLGSFKSQIAGQTGKKISPEAAAKVTKYADSVTAYQRTRLPLGATCTL